MGPRRARRAQPECGTIWSEGDIANMKCWGALVGVVCFAAQAGAQSAEVRVIVRAGALNRDARVRVHPSYAAVPEAVRKATARALQEAGLTVLTTERRQPP